MLPNLNLNHFIERARTLLDKASGRIEFNKRIPVQLSAAEMWHELKKALEDSENSRFWPNELLTMRCDGLEPHAVIEATYNFLFAKSTYHYKICQFHDGRGFSYQALKDHIFFGGGVVEIIPKGKTCVLKWRGEYRYEPVHSPQALIFKFYFQGRFFERLRENLETQLDSQ